MAKYSQIARGLRARDRGIRIVDLYGAEMTVDIGVRSGADDAGIIERVAAYTREKKGEPKAGDPTYDFAASVEIVLATTLDPASPDDNPERFFASADEVRGALDADRIAYLRARQEMFQASISPLKHSLSQEEFEALVVKIAVAEEDDQTPFANLPRSLLCAFTASIVKKLWISPLYKLPATSTESFAG